MKEGRALGAGILHPISLRGHSGKAEIAYALSLHSHPQDLVEGHRRKVQMAVETMHQYFTRRKEEPAPGHEEAACSCSRPPTGTDFPSHQLLRDQDTELFHEESKNSVR